MNLCLPLWKRILCVYLWILEFRQDKVNDVSITMIILP
ncbi:hypothetical protein AB205_0190920 [Aquarana catesbeiana]|uniref:Uncharacterized protein n=1 Tax=Aquarana catesbeiana TaxID=8400 RepID=A0A2G9S9C8_AQUCT|nr:hypothetical protein AB205_0190920 [Aquarana catesbeiana]